MSTSSQTPEQASASSVKYHNRKTTFEVVFPVAGTADLTDPVTRRTLSPASAHLELCRVETPDTVVREWAHVAVYGPRRLKSGELGRGISSFGWQAAVNRGYQESVERPEWLTTALAEQMPEGWSRALVELPEGGAR